MKKVGVIGLGNMGMGMAKNLIKSGFSVIGFDLDDKRLRKLKENGGSTATSTVQVGEETDAVFVMVMNGEQVKAVVADLVTGLKDRGTIILTATIRPEEAREAYSIADIEGVAMLDSPVSGGMDGAHNGTLTLMTAAKKSVFDDCIKILEAVSSNIFTLVKRLVKAKLLKLHYRPLLEHLLQPFLNHWCWDQKQVLKDKHYTMFLAPAVWAVLYLKIVLTLSWIENSKIPAVTFPLCIKIWV